MKSLAFAFISGTVLSLLLRCSTRDRWKPALLLVMIVASHDVLDAMTNGGLGIAFFSPWDLHRYFFPWRPIRVSPIGVRFFSNRGVAALRNEALLVWGPALVLGVLFRLLKSAKRENALLATAIMCTKRGSAAEKLNTLD